MHENNMHIRVTNCFSLSFKIQYYFDIGNGNQ